MPGSPVNVHAVERVSKGQGRRDDGRGVRRDENGSGERCGLQHIGRGPCRAKAGFGRRAVGAALSAHGRATEVVMCG